MYYKVYLGVGIYHMIKNGVLDFGETLHLVLEPVSLLPFLFTEQVAKSSCYFKDMHIFDLKCYSPPEILIVLFKNVG